MDYYELYVAALESIKKWQEITHKIERSLEDSKILVDANKELADKQTANLQVAVELIDEIRNDETGDWDFIMFLIKKYDEKIKAK